MILRELARAARRERLAGRPGGLRNAGRAALGRIPALAEDAPAEALDRAGRLEQIALAAVDLPERLQEVVQMRKAGATHEAVAAALGGLTAERARQLEGAAHLRLREQLKTAS